jgi:UDP-glucose 4-epimerase
VLNAGTGRDVSVNDLAAAIEPDPSRIVHVEHIHPQSEIAVLRCDPARAAEALGWRPQVSLDEGLAEVRAWMADRLAAGHPVA